MESVQQPAPALLPSCSSSGESHNSHIPDQDQGTQETGSPVTVIRGRRQYTVEKKLLTIADLRTKYNNNRSLCAKETGIPRPVIIRWIKEADKFDVVAASRQQSVKRVRHVVDPDQRKKYAKFPDMEDELSDWIKKQRKEGHAVDTAIVIEKGKEIYEKMKSEKPDACGETSFLASKGWASKFLQRHNFVQRAFTSVGQKVPDNAMQLMQQTFNKFDSMAKQVNVMDIANMDETPVYFDMPGGRSFDVRGVKTVKCKTTGYEKMRFTAVLTITADGKKLPPMIIFKGLKNVPKANYPKDMVVTVAKGGSMNGDLMLKYREKVWGKRGRGIFKPPALLTMDTHRSHMMESVISSFQKENRTDVMFIPGGMTPLLQPLDAYVNKSFKSKVKAEWQEWMRTGEAKFTKTGKRQRASYEVVCNWVQRAWDSVDCEMVKKSFVGCGLVTNRSIDDLHSNLQILIREKGITLEPEHTGITDDEEDDEIACSGSDNDDEQQ